MREQCKKCGAADFAIVRDMTSRRKCKCGHEWPCPPRGRLTKWEAGNEIVKAADALSEAIVELRDWPELQEPLQKMRKQVSELFEAQGLVDEMKFGI